MRRRTYLAGSAATLALPALACAEHKRILKFIPQSDLAILDPVWTTAYVTRNHGYMVFDTLYDQTGHEDGFKVTPQMAAGHVIENDGKTWKLTLRDFLQFHNGERVLASDCVTSIKRLGVRDAFGQALMARTDELFAPDDKTIVFRLKRPLALLPDALGHAASNMCAIMPRHIAETDPFKQITEKIPATVRQLSARAPVRRSSACAAATSLSHVVFATAQKNGNGPLTMPDTSVRHA